MKLKALIKRLEKDKADYHDRDVEFVICTKEGQIITMELEGQAVNLAKLLKHFGTGSPR